jgi:site-specific DNA-cytosine methylase
MRVLVACESSGTVREAFRALGHEAYSCDLLPADDGSEYHYRGDALWWAYRGKWDLLIAHPPCTYLSVSGMHWTTRGLRDPKLTEDALAFAKALFDAPVPMICIENPVSVISSRIRKPDQIIQPYEYGHDASKKTCLWLKGLPKLKPTLYVEPRTTADGKKRWANQTDSGQNRLPPSADRWKLRSKTYEGIANAMATQWGGVNLVAQAA